MTRWYCLIISTEAGRRDYTVASRRLWGQLDIAFDCLNRTCFGCADVTAISMSIRPGFAALDRITFKVVDSLTRTEPSLIHSRGCSCRCPSLLLSYWPAFVIYLWQRNARLCVWVCVCVTRDDVPHTHTHAHTHRTKENARTRSTT